MEPGVNRVLCENERGSLMKIKKNGRGMNYLLNLSRDEMMMRAR